MKAKTKFLKIYNELPEKARHEWITNYPQNPMSLYVAWIEIEDNTIMGKYILKDAGFEDD
jgi:hypothetical protein